jgi:hypothetical protein
VKNPCILSSEDSMKVYILKNKDGEFGSHNFAIAYDGFRKMGWETVFYRRLDSTRLSDLTAETDRGETLLIEINDGYSIGSYGLFSADYARLLASRWAQMTGARDFSIY